MTFEAIRRISFIPKVFITFTPGFWPGAKVLMVMYLFKRFSIATTVDNLSPSSLTQGT